MLRRRIAVEIDAVTRESAFDDFHDWLLSLPWVTERPYSLGTRGVRCFEVDCEPLDRRQLLLITGLETRLDAHRVGLAVIVPMDAARHLEEIGWGRIATPMPRGDALVTVPADALAGRQELEALALTAYSFAMS